MANLQNLTRPQQSNNTPGLKIIHRYALYNQITSLPAPTVLTNFDDVVTVTGNIVFETGKQFFKIEGVLDKNSLDGQGSEQLDAAGVDNMVKIFIENTPENLGFCQTLKNSNLVFLIEDQQGNQRLLGQDGLPARIMGYAIKGGSAQPDEKHIEVTIKSVGAIAPFYTGTIQDTPAP